MKELKNSIISQSDYDCVVERLTKHLNVPSLKIFKKESVENSQPKPFEIILWCDELYVVESSCAMSGVVRHLDFSMASNNFYWDYLGEKLCRVGSISEKDFNNLLEEHLNN